VSRQIAHRRDRGGGWPDKSAGPGIGPTGSAAPPRGGPGRAIPRRPPPRWRLP